MTHIAILGNPDFYHNLVAGQCSGAPLSSATYAAPVNLAPAMAGILAGTCCLLRHAEAGRIRPFLCRQRRGRSTRLPVATHIGAHLCSEQGGKDDGLLNIP